jgi:hypothetical protein
MIKNSEYIFITDIGGTQLRAGIVRPQIILSAPD